MKIRTINEISKCNFWANENGIKFSEDFSTNSRTNVMILLIQKLYLHSQRSLNECSIFIWHQIFHQNIKLSNTLQIKLTFKIRILSMKNANEKSINKKISDSFGSISAQLWPLSQFKKFTNISQHSWNLCFTLFALYFIKRRWWYD